MVLLLDQCSFLLDECSQFGVLNKTIQGLGVLYEVLGTLTGGDELHTQVILLKG
mgnify:FL=1